MPRHNWYEMGQYNMQCDQCGRVFKSSEMMKRWDNAMVDAACWEPRQPQDYIGQAQVKDFQTAPVIRVRPPLTTTYLLIPVGDGRAQMFQGTIPTYSTYVEVYAKVALGDWSPTGSSVVIYSQYNIGSLTTFYVGINTTGAMFIVWKPVGAAAITVPSTANLSATAAGATLYLKWTLATSGYTVTFWSSTDGVTYTQLGSTVTGTATTIASSGALPTIGNFVGGGVGTPTELKVYNVYVNAAADAAPQVQFNSDLGAPSLTQFFAQGQVYLLTDASFVTP